MRSRRGLPQAVWVENVTVDAEKGRSAKARSGSLLSELESVAVRLSIAVRYEKGEMRGGLCRVRDCLQVIINADLPDEEKADLLAESLAQANLRDIYITPRIRQLIEQLGNHCT